MTSEPPSARAPARRISKAEFVAAAQSASELPAPVGIEVAFAGRSNVGKSSLMNELMGRRNLVRTSRTPGSTRHIALFKVAFNDQLELTLVDLPGYGYARRSKTERRGFLELIDHYLFQRPTLRAVVLLFDARRGLETEEEELLAALETTDSASRPDLKVILVATKIDLLPASERKLKLAAIGRKVGRRIVGFSTETPGAAEALWRVLFPCLGYAPLKT